MEANDESKYLCSFYTLIATLVALLSSAAATGSRVSHHSHLVHSKQITSEVCARKCSCVFVSVAFSDDYDGFLGIMGDSCGLGNEQAIKIMTM